MSSPLLFLIAHAFSVTELGLDNFTSFLPEALLGKIPWPRGYFVGGNPNPEPPSQSQALGRARSDARRCFSIA